MQSHTGAASSEVVVALAESFREDDLACLLAEVLEELGYLVRVHAGSRHLDRSRPVEVVVTQIKCQLLNDGLRNRAVIVGDIEMSGKNATLSGSLRHQVEVVLALSVLVLHDLSVDQASRRRVHQTVAVVFQEETLSDPLVDDDDSDLRLDLSQVVGLIDGLSELSHLLLEDLSAHSIADTVTIDYEVLRVAATLVSKGAESSLDSLLELRANDLLSLLLDDAVTPVLAESLVDRGTEAHYRHRSRVTHIDTDEHGKTGDLRRELELIEVTTKLGVDLPQHIASDRKVHALAEVLIADALRDDVVLVAEGLVRLVVPLVP